MTSAAGADGKPADFEAIFRDAGMDPAERTSMRSPAMSRRKPAAIWERPALCTQTNRTEGFDVLLMRRPLRS